jgi:hypothetical protein
MPGGKVRIDTSGGPAQPAAPRAAAKP